MISIEENHVTCDSSVRTYSQAVSNKHPPGGRALVATHWHEWIIGFTRSPLAGRVDLPAKVLHESETGPPVKDEARHHIVAACTGCYGIFLDCVCDGLVEALQCALSHIRHTLVRIPNCSLFKDQAA